MIVKPETLIAWHRKGFRLFWRWKSRPGRPQVPATVRELIVRMVRENPTLGPGTYRGRALAQARDRHIAANRAEILALAVGEPSKQSLFTALVDICT
jgi:hypothetical protein